MCSTGPGVGAVPDQPEWALDLVWGVEGEDLCGFPCMPGLAPTPDSLRPLRHMMSAPDQLEWMLLVVHVPVWPQYAPSEAQSLTSQSKCHGCWIWHVGEGSVGLI